MLERNIAARNPALSMVEPGSGAKDPTIFLARHKNAGGVACENKF